MKSSYLLLEKLKDFEGLRLEAYLDAAGVPTIGYGHTGRDVKLGDRITKYWADDLLRRIFRSRLNQRLFALLPPSWTFPFAQRWSDSNKEKHARQDTLHYLGDDREGIVRYCKERLHSMHIGIQSTIGI